MKNKLICLILILTAMGCSKPAEESPTVEESPVVEEVETVEAIPEPQPEPETFARHSPDIPQNAYKYRRLLIRLAQYHDGLEAPINAYAAQIHKESTWRPTVCSPYACGLTQFTESTAEYVGEKFAELGTGDVMEPQWAIRAMLHYNEYLVDRSRGADRCNSWAKALSAYNGGIGWLRRDEKVTEEAGADKSLWWDNVEIHKDPRRRDDAVRENTNYPKRILLELQPLYFNTDFGSGELICEQRWS